MGFASGSGVLATHNIYSTKYTPCAVIFGTDVKLENKLNSSPVPLTTVEFCTFCQRRKQTLLNCVLSAYQTETIAIFKINIYRLKELDAVIIVPREGMVSGQR